jgi:hypothetical protein
MDPRFFERYPELAHDIPMNKRDPVGARVGFADGMGVDDERFGMSEG